MNTELNNLLQSCMDSCDRLLSMTEEDEERIRGALSGELMDTYLQGCVNSREKLKRLRERLAALQTEARYGL